MHRTYNIFNAINNGLLVIEYATAGLADGDLVSIDLDSSEIAMLGSGLKQPLRPLPPQIRAILREGGLIPYLRKHPDWEITQ